MRRSELTTYTNDGSVVRLDVVVAFGRCSIFDVSCLIKDDGASIGEAEFAEEEIL